MKKIFSLQTLYFLIGIALLGGLWELISTLTNRTMLPIPDAQHIGLTTYDAKDPNTRFPPIEPLGPPAGAPNILVVLIDDAGFGSSSAFGGPCQTPNAEKLAAGGLKYTRFHTTALCAPTRQALLTGRNHHSVNMGAVCELATSAPGNTSIRPKNKVPVAETLKLNGYSTAQFGKCHEVPVWQTSPMGPFDAWPTGSGFEYFFGFLGGETNQYYPAIYEGTTPLEPEKTPEQGYHFTEAPAVRPEPEEPELEIACVPEPSVGTWERRYRSQRGHWEVHLDHPTRGGRHLVEQVQRMVGDAGLPPEVAFLPTIESGYRSDVRGLGGSGLWQLGAATARRYGLVVTPTRDDRLNPTLSTKVALRHLSYLYDRYGDWPLALAAYNAGEGKISRVIAATGQTDFWKLVDRRVLRAETNNYVPAIIPATLISREPRTFGFDFVPDPPLEYDTVNIQGPLHLRAIARTESPTRRATASACTVEQRQHQEIVGP